MKVCLPFLLVLCLCAGCANPGHSYASKHPELPPAHRRILESGSIPGGDAVAGMTREQVKLAMGRDPDTFDKINGEDAWIYSRKKTVGRESFDDLGQGGSSSMGETRSFTQREDFAPRSEVEAKVTVFFQGDRATHALNTEEAR